MEAAILKNTGNNKFTKRIWAPSSEFVSSSIPSWQIVTAHAQPFRGARDLVFCLKVPLDSLLVWASSGGSGETARMRRLAWTFAARICDKYQIRLTRSILFLKLMHTHTDLTHGIFVCYVNNHFVGLFYKICSISTVRKWHHNLTDLLVPNSAFINFQSSINFLFFPRFAWNLQQTV